MKRNFLKTAARCGLGTILQMYSAIAHCEEDPISKWSAAHALPLTTVESTADDSDLLPLKAAIGTARVVAFGEPKHRTAALRGQRKVRLYGIDITAGGRKSGPRLALDSALTYLARADPTTAKKIRDSLSDSLPGTDSREIGPLPEATQAEFEASIEAVAKAMQKSRKSLIARTSEDIYRWALHNLDVARQVAKCLRITPPPGADMNAWAPTMTCRDTSMAENVQWALKNEGRQGRLLVFAHLGHVMAAKGDGRRTAMVREKSSMMGLPLRRAYGNDLYIHRRAHGAAERGGSHVAFSAAVRGCQCRRPNHDHAVDRGGCFRFRELADGRNSAL
jgi:erythromycin esterase-like protein